MSHVALPHAYGCPAQFGGPSIRATISFGGPPQLLLPQVGVGAGPCLLSPMLRTAVPEATVDEDRDPAARQHDVWCAAGSQSPLQAEAQTGGMERLA